MKSFFPHAIISRLRNDDAGVAMIEFALILPVLLLILLGVVEFGVYFMKEQIVQRTVSSAVSDIKQDPNNEMNKDNAVGSGSGVVDYTAIGNYICAQSYATVADAKSGLCAGGDWVTTAPTSNYTAGAPYYVALVAYVQESSFTELFKNYIPPIKVTSVFKAGIGNSASTGTLAGYCTTMVTQNATQVSGIPTFPAIKASNYGPNACGCDTGWQQIETGTTDSGTTGNGRGYTLYHYSCIKQ